MSATINRRRFNAAAAGAALAATATAAGPNNEVRLGFIGVGNRGGQLLDAFRQHSDARIVAVCDAFEPYIARAKKKLGGDVVGYEDFRKLLERPDLDAVVIATPDHWHALQTVAACRAGKDVYVEKPLSITVVEGRRMVEVARETKRVVQVGLHRRSTVALKKLAEFVRSGAIGKVTVARAYRLSNMYPAGIGKAADTEPTAGLNWDLWLGPRPERRFNATIAPYKFRWWQAYSSQMANWGVHYLDVIRWALGDVAPVSLCALGGKFAVDDARDIPDTLEATFELPSGCLAIFGQYEANGNPTLRTGEVELRGTQGTVYTSEQGYEVFPETGGQFQDRKPRRNGVTFRTKEKNDAATAAHARNFLDCVKSRTECNCPIEEGHRSTSFALLANISLATRARLDWDPVKEVVTNHPAANRLLHYEYRKPWTLG